VFAPHRSPTQIDLPSLSISTALVDPHVRPSGSLKLFSIGWNGFGASLVGLVSACVDTKGMYSPMAATIALNSVTFARPVSGIARRLSGMEESARIIPPAGPLITDAARR
jgi:hypothetical protein